MKLPLTQNLIVKRGWSRNKAYDVSPAFLFQLHILCVVVSEVQGRD